MVAFASREFAEGRQRLIGATPDIKVALDQLGAIQKQLDDLAEAYGDREITMSEWRAAKRKLEPSLEVAQRAVESGTQDAARLIAPLDLEELARDWDGLPIERRRAVIRLLIEQIGVFPHRGEVRRLDPDRLWIVWRDAPGVARPIASQRRRRARV